jgi:hypothetical protein
MLRSPLLGAVIGRQAESAPGSATGGCGFRGRSFDPGTAARGVIRTGEVIDGGHSDWSHFAERWVNAGPALLSQLLSHPVTVVIAEGATPAAPRPVPFGRLVTVGDASPGFRLGSLVSGVQMLTVLSSPMRANPKSSTNPRTTATVASKCRWCTATPSQARRMSKAKRMPATHCRRGQVPTADRSGCGSAGRPHPSRSPTSWYMNALSRSSTSPR